MTHTQHGIETVVRTLEAERGSLSSEQKEVLWGRIVPALTPHSVLSPYTFLGLEKRVLAGVLVAVLTIAGAGGTAVASESARPGDILFPIDRAIEDARLALVLSDDARTTLARSFADERLTEFRDIVAEEVGQLPRSSAALSDTGRVRVGGALRDVTQFLDKHGVKDERVFTQFAEETRDLNVQFDDVRFRREAESVRMEYREDDDEDESRFEYRDDETRVRIKTKDGSARIEEESRDTSRDESSDDERDEADDNDQHDETENGDDDESGSSDDDEDGSDDDRDDDSSGSGDGSDDSGDDKDDDEDDEEGEDDRDEDAEDSSGSSSGSDDD
jgi:hypothetical protein